MKKNIKNSNEIDELYMDWINFFLRDKSGFTCDFYKYNNEGENNLNVENVAKLEHFFRFIEKYADNKKISSDGRVGEFFATKKYYVRYKKNIYAIGYISDNETIFYCSSVYSNKNMDNVIEFDNLEKYINQESAKRKKVVHIESKQKNTKKNTKKRTRTI